MSKYIVKLALFILVFFAWLVKVSDIKAACVFDWEHCMWGCDYVCHSLGCPYGYSEDSRCFYEQACIDCSLPGYPPGGQMCKHFVCDNYGSYCNQCFTKETAIYTPKGKKEIQDLAEGDEVISQNPQTLESKASKVEAIYETDRDAYYVIKTEDGKEIKVTAEHPLYAIRQEEKPLTFWEYLKTESLVKKTIDWLVDTVE